MNKKRKLSRIGKILIVFLAVFALAGGAVAAGLSTREHVHADPALPGGHGANGNQEPETYTITTTADPTAGGNVTGYGTYLESENVTVTATPSAGYAFVQWEENGAAVSTDASYTFTVQENRTLTAVFEKKAKVTYKIVNGTWADDSTGEKVVWIKKGQENTDIPTGMKAPNTYCNGSWDNDPEGAVITGDTTYTYTYTDRRKPTAVILKSDPNVTIAANGRHNVDYHVVRTDNNNIVYAGYSDVLMNGSKDGQKVLVGGDEIGVLIGGKGGPNGDENDKTYDTIARYSIFGSKLGIGQHTVEFSFPGNNYYAPSSAVVQVTVTDGMQYNVNLTAEPSAGGTVTGGGTYNANANVTVTATPSAGYAFVQWEEGGSAVSTDASYTFKASADRDLTAKFAETYPVTLECDPAAGGNITITNVSATTQGTERFAEGEQVELSITANNSYRFIKLTVNGTNCQTRTELTTGERTASFPMPGGPVTVKAEFSQIGTTPNTRTLNVYADPIEGGTVTGGGTFIILGNVMVTATANSGYVFDGWYNGTTKVSDLPYYKVRLNESVTTLIAKFVQGKTVNVQADPAAGGTVIGGRTYKANANVTVIARPSAGYAFMQWEEGGTAVSTDAIYSFEASADRDLTAKFVQMHTVTFHDGNVELSTLDVADGDKAARPDPDPAKAGHAFKGWYADPGLKTPFDFTQEITADTDIYAKFVQTHTVTLVCDPVDGGTATGGGKYEAGTFATVTAVPNEGYEFAGWYEVGATVSKSFKTSYTFPVKGDVNLEARFNAKKYKINIESPSEAGSVKCLTNEYGGITIKSAEAGTKVYVKVRETENLVVNRILCDNEPLDLSNGATLGEKNAKFTMPSNDVTITVVWETKAPEYYHVWYNGDGSVLDSKWIQASMIIPEPDKTPTKEEAENYTYEFDHWDSSVGEYSWKRIHTPVFTKTLKPGRHIITVNAEPDAGGNVAGGGIYTTGSDATVTATPDRKYSFKQWEENGAVVSTDASYTFTAEKDRNLTAVFEVNSVLTIQAEKDTYTYGEDVTVSGTLTDANGEKIVNEEIKLSVNGTDLLPASPVKTDADGKYTYTIISRPDAGDCKVKAAFEGVAGSIRGSTAETEVNIYKRPVKITADDKICTDLDAADPLTWTMEDEADNWFKTDRADILLTVTDGDGNTIAPETAEPGRYTVTPSWKTENTNYDATFVSGVVDTTHDWGDWTQTKDPTVDEEGEETRVCSRDPSHIETRPVPRLPVTLTFNIVNGTWDDGSATTTARAVKGTVLTAGDVPVPEPDSGYGVGEWDVEPVGAEVEGEATFTYTYKHYNISYNTGSIGTAPGDETSYWHDYYGKEVLGHPAYLKPAESGDDAYTFDIYNPWYDNPEFNGDPVEYMTEVVRDMILYTKWIGPKKVIESASVNVTATKGDAIPDGQMIDPADLADFYLESPAGADYHIGWVMWENPDGDAAFVPGKTYTVMFALGTSTGENEYSGFFKGHQSAKTGEYTWDVSKAYALTVNGEGANDSIQDVGAYSSMVRYEYTVPEHGLEHVAAKAETCTEDGNREYWVCTRGSHPCGKYFSDAAGKNEISKEETVVKAKGHDPGDAVKENEKAADCETDGSYDEVVYCKTCKKELTRKTVKVDATGHKWGKWTVSKPATCTEKGEEQAVCEHDSSHVDTREIAATGHDPGDAVKENEKVADCETDGSYDEVVYCKTCKNELSRKQVIVKATGHAWGDWTVTKEPTETEDGVKTKVCSHNPKHIETQGIPATGHVHDLEKIAKKDAGCTTPGMKEHYKCEKCGLLYTDAKGSVHISEEALVIPPAGHTEGEKTKRVVKDATCEEAGSYYEEIHCSVCGELLKEELKTEPALGHDWDEWKETKAATCTTAGEKKRICKRDDSHTETKEIPATGHDWGDWTTIEAATEIKEGKEERVCNNNSEHKETRSIPVTGHVHKLTKVEAKAADCESEGNTEYWICDQGDNPCRHLFADEAGRTEINIEDTVVKATEHKAKDAVKENEIAANCETEGSYDEVIYCEHCGKELSRETKKIKATGHEWDEGVVTTEATCNGKGEKTFTCKHDKLHTRTEEIPAIGHKWGEWTVTKPATCTEKGEEQAVCEHDKSHVETKPIDATGHEPGDVVIENKKEAGCETAGSYDEVVYCKTCKTELSRKQVTIKATGHDWGEWKNTKAATETEEGTKERICKNDPEHKETRSIPVIGHVHQLTKVEAKAADCESEGNTEYWICDKGDNPCGHIFADAEGKTEINIKDTVVKATEHKSKDAVRENEVAATCETDGSYDEVVYCEHCNKELSRNRVTVKATGHDWGDWTVTKEPTETEDGIETRICKNDQEHKETRKIPAANHVHDIEKIAGKEPGCTASGLKEHYKCKKCGLLYTDAKGNVQINEEALVILPAGHTEGEKTKRVVTEANCEEAGSYYEEIHCSVCGELLKEELMSEPALGHDWDGWKETKAATCTAAGEKKRICKRDDSHAEVKEIPATGHDWGEWEETKEATETEEGTEVRICKNDPEHKETQSIPVIGHVHQLTKVEAKAADCDSEGNTEYWICDKGNTPCGHIFADEEGKTQINQEDTVVKVTEHKGGPAVKEKEIPATCETEGSYVEVVYCEHCGEELSREIKAIPATGHDWDDGVITTEATCNGKGEKTFTCKHDKLHTKTEEIPATGHKWSEWTESKPAACTEKGEEQRVCEHDKSHVETRYVDPTGHDWGEWKVTREATETEDGTEERICKNDPDHKESRIIPAKGQDPGPDDNEEKKIYNCIYGNGNVWTKGSGVNSDFTFTRIEDDESTFDHYTELYADDRKLTDAEAVVRSGSLKVSLLPEFLETLAVGDHTLRAEFDDGSAQAGFTVLAKADPGQETEDDPDGGKEKDDPGKQDNGGEKDDPGKQGNSGEQSGTDTNNNNDKKDKEEAKNSNNDSNDSGATKNEATDKNTNVTEGKTVTVRSSNAANTASGSGVVSTYGKSASNAAATGDTNNNYLWLLLLIIPAAVITGALAVKRRKTRE